ncbi:MAG: 16S rRNA (guanine(966)-N(2))-methyltransferase RsmD [Ruminococcaceae bacterium]|nr:16S rRNA (guanine(966)-N(2))-methyltransferase RsmD [Oscillospiraceae bacterium]
MRIITGSAKGVSLYTLEGEATRPTSQRVKEAIFSMLQFDIEDRAVLDLFAGCGQLSLEALSRGAQRSVMVDASREACGVIRRNVEKTKMTDRTTVISCDYREYLLRNCDRFDLIFIDPPYASELCADVLRRLLQSKALKPTTLIVCESGSENVFASDKQLKEKFDVIKSARYSISYVTILKPKEELI